MQSACRGDSANCQGQADGSMQRLRARMRKAVNDAIRKHRLRVERFANNRIEAGLGARQQSDVVQHVAGEWL